MKIEIAEENLRKFYIEENHTLKETSIFFQTPLGTLRKVLKRNNIHKTQKMAAANSLNSLKRKTHSKTIFCYT